jgi:hypothetical protein
MVRSVVPLLVPVSSTSVSGSCAAKHLSLVFLSKKTVSRANPCSCGQTRAFLRGLELRAPARYKSSVGAAPRRRGEGRALSRGKLAA